MHSLFDKFINHTDLYKLSIYTGTIFTSLYTFLSDFTEKDFLGTSLILWLLLFLINIIDIHTGIKADTKRKKEVGSKFTFESGKGWRAVEKIFIFTVVIGFIFIFEKEAIKLELPNIIPAFLTYIKLIVFFYAFLIELQSIGENEEVRFGKKGKMFIMLDNIIEVTNEGILKKIKSFFSNSSNNNDNEPPIEEIEQ